MMREKTYDYPFTAIVDGKLYYIRNYNAKEKMLHVIEMPEETADYFIDLVNSLDSPYRFT